MLEGYVVLDDEINDIQVRQNVAQVVKHAVVQLLLEALFVKWVFVVEEPIHLEETVLGEEHNFLQAVEECIQHGQDARSLDLNLTCLLLLGSWVV